MAEVINPDVQGTPNFCQQFLPCSLLTYAGGVDELFTINLESKKTLRDAKTKCHS